MSGAMPLLLAAGVICLCHSAPVQARSAAPHLDLQQGSIAELDTQPSVHARSLAQASSEQQQRIGLANHAAGLNLVFYEGQRAGRAGLASQTYTQVWSWKKPAFIDACRTLRDVVASEGGPSTVGFKKWPGTFEAGNTVIVTGISAFAIAQRVLGALHFSDVYEHAPKPVLEDKPGCLPSKFQKHSTNYYLRTQLGRQAHALMATILNWDAKDVSKFMIVTGISDSSCFNEMPSWQQPSGMQDRCYVATSDKPAADTAAMVATALAMLSHYFRTTPGAGAYMSNKLANSCETKALAAYAYAKAMYVQHGESATCSASSAIDNCVGDCSEGFLSPCTLYASTMGPQRHLFTAAAALYQLTGESSYRDDADSMYWNPEDVMLTKLINWDNPWMLGAAVMAGTKEPTGAAVSNAAYLAAVADAVSNWSQCSNEGQSGDFCKRTEAGHAFSVLTPAGNVGMALNAVCLAGVYQKLAPKRAKTGAKAAQCFMQRQVGYTVNAKCTGGGSKCVTPSEEGFSYMVGMGSYYPEHVHSRDASLYPFSTLDADKNTLCGAVVSGPDALDGYTDVRLNFDESEPAIDYASGVVCAFGAYASQPSGAFEHCTDVRGPFTGR